MYVIEMCRDGKHWRPVGISKIDNLDIVREVLPGAKGCDLRLRAFVRIPGVYVEGEREVGLVPVINEKGKLVK